MDDVSLKFLGISLLSLHLYMYFTKPFDQRAAKENRSTSKITGAQLALLEITWKFATIIHDFPTIAQAKSDSTRAAAGENASFVIGKWSSAE